MAVCTRSHTPLRGDCSVREPVRENRSDWPLPAEQCERQSHATSRSAQPLAHRLACNGILDRHYGQGRLVTPAAGSGVFHLFASRTITRITTTPEPALHAGNPHHVRGCFSYGSPRRAAPPRRPRDRVAATTPSGVPGRRVVRRLGSPSQRQILPRRGKSGGSGRASNRVNASKHT